MTFSIMTEIEKINIFAIISFTFMSQEHLQPSFLSVVTLVHR